MTTVWHSGIARAIAGRRFVFVGSGVALAEGLRAHGADVAAIVVVVAAGAPPAEHRAVPVISMTAPTPSWLVLQAEAFPSTLVGGRDRIRRLLDAVDPDGTAVVVGNVTVPAAIADGRTSWAPESATAAAVEAKLPTGSPVSSAVPWIPSLPVPPVVGRRWWDDTSRAFGAERVVVQRLGPGAGGITTWVCDGPAAASAAVAACGGRGARVSPFVDGVPVNVMAVVVHGGVLVLPPTRQIVMTIDGQPIYAGNDTSCCPARDRLIEGARVAGSVLASRGYRGPFGLDAIVTPDGAALFHDLNARVNGAVHAFSLRLPVYIGTLVAPGWVTPATIDDAEREVAASVHDRPLARWSLTVRPDEETTLGAVPGPATCRVDVDGGVLVQVGAEDPAAVGGDRVVVRPRVAAGTRLAPGVDVTVADMWCEPMLSGDVIARYGDQASARFAASFLAGFR